MSSDKSYVPDDISVPTSSKPKKRKYAQKFKTEWESEFKNWLAPGKTDTEGYCKVCDKNINVTSGKLQLVRHQDSEVHRKKSKSVKSQQSLVSFIETGKERMNLEVATKRADLYISAFVTEHNLPFTVAEHIPQLMSKVCCDSEVAKKIKCSRTKTTSIVKNVIGKLSSKNVYEILKSVKFSLIIDESTDLSTTKHLVIICRYFDGKEIRDRFLTLIAMKSAKSADIYREIVDFLNKNNIPYLKNLIGFASDGANVMAGAHESVMAKLKTDIPHIFLMKCVCHSFALCSSSACIKLPRAVEDCVRNIYNYIANSPKRIEVLKEFQNFTQTKIHKILHPSQTRWLSLETVVCRIIEQYSALKLYFIDAVTTDKLQAAENILKVLQDPLTLAFLLFLQHILPLFNNLNREMQSTEPKLYILHIRMCETYRTLVDYFIKRSVLDSTQLQKIDVNKPENYKNIENIYLGANLTQYILNNNLSAEEIHILRVRCLDFYIEATLQLSKRYDFDNDILKSMRLINPEYISKCNDESLVPLAMHFPNLVSPNDMQKLDNEWRLFKNSDLIRNFKNDESIISFWLKVQQQTYADETQIFSLLSLFAFNLLSLPHSSADAERKFSQINLLKTKQRNSLSTSTIVGLMQSKEYIETECYNIHISHELLSYHNSNNIYKKSDQYSDSE